MTVHQKINIRSYFKPANKYGLRVSRPGNIHNAVEQFCERNRPFFADYLDHKKYRGWKRTELQTFKK
jgi:hypothetical protein